MSKFKAGDRVVELSTGDRGIVEGPTGDGTHVRGGVQITELRVLWDAIPMTDVNGRGELRAWIGDDKLCFESEFKDTMPEEELAAIKLLEARGYTITRN